MFISHATSEDGSLVNWIADSLDRLHLRAFVYERYPRGGQNRFELIKNMIQKCPHFLALLTSAGITSQWVNQEIGYAVGAGKCIIPIIEVDNHTGRRIESSGFVELHDPINYYRDDTIQLMADIIYTFYGWLVGEGKWEDSIFLSCNCGYTFEGDLQFDRHWEKWLNDPFRRPFAILYQCDKCDTLVRVSFPDCHLLQ